MVNLTQPALLCFGSVPQDPSVRHHFLQVLTYLQAYKEVRSLFSGVLGQRSQKEEGGVGSTYELFPVPQAFASEKAFGVLSETLYELLQLVSVSPSYASTGQFFLPWAEEGAMPGKVLLWTT